MMKALPYRNGYAPAYLQTNLIVKTTVRRVQIAITNIKPSSQNNNFFV
jgi:hypothetical protein